VGLAHTNNDILVYIPQEKVLVTGDLITSATYFGFRINQITDVDRLLSVLDRILNAPDGVETVITSHTKILSGEDLRLAQSYIAEKYAPYRTKSSAAKLLQSLISENTVEDALKTYEKKVSNTGYKIYFLEEEYNVLGRLYLSMGQFEAALAVFNSEAKFFPQSALAYDNLGEAYLKMGKTQEAIENYEKSLAIMPYNLNAEQMLNILRPKN
jgi:tetratricopeptide (TPR) repeat protein